MNEPDPTAAGSSEPRQTGHGQTGHGQTGLGGAVPPPRWTPPAPPAWSPRAPEVPDPRDATLQCPADAEHGRRAARPRQWRAALVAAAIAALVASLVTAGAFVVFDDDSGSSSASTAPLVTAPSLEADPAAQNDTSGLRAVLEAVRPAVVRITVDTGFAQGEGTGFIVSNDGVIVTNAHVAGDVDEVLVTLADGDEERATLLGSDPQHDLAVIKIDRTGLPTVRIGDSDPPATQVGDPVIAIGNALGLQGDLSVTTGIVSALDRQLEIDAQTVLVSVIQTDAAINPGNSGGPLVNRRGEVIGINTAIAPPEESNNVGFAISISSAKPIIEALRAGRDPQIAFLGVESEDVTPQLAAREDLVADAGAYITDVVEGSPADDAGLRIGDVVVELNGRTIDGRASLLRTIRRNEPGDRIDLVIERDGENETLGIELGTLPENNV